VAENPHEYSDVDTSATTASSGVTSIVMLQQNGYAFMST
jgi:intracellular sulfur oxidation DsrE/DsrF family protein